MEKMSNDIAKTIFFLHILYGNKIICITQEIPMRFGSRMLSCFNCIHLLHYISFHLLKCCRLIYAFYLHHEKDTKKSEFNENYSELVDNNCQLQPVLL